MKNKILLLFVMQLCASISSLYPFSKPNLPFPKQSSVRKTSYPLISGDTIRAFCDHIFDETDVLFNPKLVKRGDVVFVNGDHAMLEAFFKQAHPLILYPYILVSHNSDHYIPGKYSTYLDDPNIMAWYSQNIDRVHPKLFGLPIGLANYHWPHGKIEIIQEVMKNLPPFETRSNKLYVNFLRNTNAKIRNPVWNFFSGKSFCYMASRKEYKEYLEEMSQYKFVLSPPGNGVDCHRNWEALLLRCIPVVLHSSIDCLFKDLPVIMVYDFKSVTEDFLTDEYGKIKSIQFNYDKLYADYWFNEIKRSSLQNVENGKNNT